MVMLPKLMLEGATANCPETVQFQFLSTPTETAGFEALDVMVQAASCASDRLWCERNRKRYALCGVQGERRSDSTEGEPGAGGGAVQMVDADPPELESVSVGKHCCRWRCYRS